jgi:peptide/nickel transport system ATP-binding protein
MRWTRSCAAWSDAMSANNETNMLLSIQDLKVAFRMGTVNGQEQLAEAVGRGSDGELRRAGQQHGGPGGRVGLGQERDGHVHPEPAAGQRPPQRPHPLAGPGPAAGQQALRGREIACVFQDPMSSLNPVFTIGQQLMEPLQLHLGMGAKAALEKAEALLAEVGIPEPKRRLKAYPHELSGGSSSG